METAARLSPELSAPLFLLAVAEQQLHRADVSAEILRKLIALEPLNPDVHYLLAQNLFRLGKTSDAMQEWKRVLEINPDHVKALFDLSRALSKTRPVEARRYPDWLLGVQQRLWITGEAEMLQSFALVSANAREWPEALQQLREAVRICGECQSRAAIHKNLGLVYSRSGDLKNGERELRLALDLKPDDVETLKTFKMVQAAHH